MNNSPKAQHTKEIEEELHLLKPWSWTWSPFTPSVSSYPNPQAGNIWFFCLKPEHLVDVSMWNGVCVFGCVCGGGNREREIIWYFKWLKCWQCCDTHIFLYVHSYIYIYTFFFFFTEIYGHRPVTPPWPELQIFWWLVNWEMVRLYPPLGVEGGMHIQRGRYQWVEDQCSWVSSQSNQGPPLPSWHLWDVTQRLELVACS